MLPCIAGSDTDRPLPLSALYAAIVVHLLAAAFGSDIWSAPLLGSSSLDSHGGSRPNASSEAGSQALGPSPHSSTLQARYVLAVGALAAALVLLVKQAVRVFATDRRNAPPAVCGHKEITRWYAFLHIETLLVMLLAGSTWLTSAHWHWVPASSSVASPTGHENAVTAGHGGFAYRAAQLGFGLAYGGMAFELKLAAMAREPFIPAVAPKFIIALTAVNGFFRLMDARMVNGFIVYVQAVHAGVQLRTVLAQLHADGADAGHAL